MKRVPRTFKAAVPVALALLCACAPTRPPDENIKKGEVVGGFVVTPEETLKGQVKQQRAIAKKQEEELAKQQKEIDDLRRQQYQNDRLKEYLDRTHADSPNP